MTFDMPYEETLAPSPPLLDLSSVEATAETVASFGKASHIGRLAKLTSLRQLWVSGVNASQARVVGSLGQLRSLVIHDWRVRSLEELSGLKALDRLAICGSGRLKSPNGIQALQNLRELVLFFLTGVESLVPLPTLGGLEVLSIDGGVYKKLRLPSFQPLASLGALKRLRLASVQVVDRSLRPLHALSNLRDIFIVDTFPKQELRDLAKALPLARGEFLDTYRGVAA